MAGESKFEISIIKSCNYLFHSNSINTSFFQFVFSVRNVLISCMICSQFIFLAFSLGITPVIQSFSGLYYKSNCTLYCMIWCEQPWLACAVTHPFLMVTDGSFHPHVPQEHMFNNISQEAYWLMNQHGKYCRPIRILDIDSHQLTSTS